VRTVPVCAHPGYMQPLPARRPVPPFPSGEPRHDRWPPGQKTACGVVSLRRHCPDQVLGVAVQPPSCPASQPSRRDSGYPAVGAVQLPRSPRRRRSGCTRRGRAPRAESPGMPGPNVVSAAQAKAAIRPGTRCPGTAFPAASPRPRLRTVWVSGVSPRARGTAAFMLPWSPPARSLTGGRRPRPAENRFPAGRKQNAMTAQATTAGCWARRSPPRRCAPSSRPHLRMGVRFRSSAHGQSDRSCPISGRSAQRSDPGCDQEFGHK